MYEDIIIIFAIISAFTVGKWCKKKMYKIERDEKEKERNETN